MFWDVQAVQKAAGIGPLEAAGLIKALVRARLANANRGRYAKTWTTTDQAQKFGGTTAAKPIRRETAERALREFIGRVQDVNRNAYFLAKATKVVVFGAIYGRKWTSPSNCDPRSPTRSSFGRPRWVV
jgi:hypothetical protein